MLLNYSDFSFCGPIILCENFSLYEEWCIACSYVASVMQTFAIGALSRARSSLLEFQTIFLNDFKMKVLSVSLSSSQFLHLNFSNHIATFVTLPLLSELSF